MMPEDDDQDVDMKIREAKVTAGGRRYSMMIEMFIASEGEGLNNQYESIKLREAKVTDHRRKVLL